MVKVYPPFVNYFEMTKETVARCDRDIPRFHAFLKVKSVISINEPAHRPPVRINCKPTSSERLSDQFSIVLLLRSERSEHSSICCGFSLAFSEPQCFALW